MVFPWCFQECVRPRGQAAFAGGIAQHSRASFADGRQELRAERFAFGFAGIVLGRGGDKHKARQVAELRQARRKHVLVVFA